MTREEFLRGWMLLTTQPWGKVYRSDSPEATIQLELYWRGVERVNPYVWQAICEAHAAGDHWPSLSELKTAIHHNSKSLDPLPIIERNPAIEWQSAPVPLRLVFDHQALKQCTLKEAAFAILPPWLSEHAHHEDYVDAALFLQKAKANFGITKERGNLRCIP